MSRHKLVKDMDFDNELDDYDGGAAYDHVEGETESEGGHTEN